MRKQSPARWQASTFPERFRKKISVVHDGIDTRQLIPWPDASMTLNHQIQVTRKDTVTDLLENPAERQRLGKNA
ncbi:hypothetical protein [Desulfotignum phosphitoxidans]|uniref:Glycosyl transferase family 4 domain-containing protein n=1 Tax=Desulfotignum phosphitoxidans DSM 13687 TaxID=1286635 RepID=S0G709_9BACT|nr:hypothetical protein [Desulfotignum phosphitoxidans]EMS80491.1 hypothetical protein Dpo_2c01800 [Desulfotignum phosphitoxidans DSM 13687]